MRFGTRNTVFLVFIVMSCCSTKPQEIPTERDITSRIAGAKANVNQIVLINAGDIDRCQIGELVQSISKCNPKVIGINFMFIEKKEAGCDSTLSASFIDSDKVVLIETFRDGNHIESNKQFTEAALLTGTSGLIQNEPGIIDHYYRLIDFRGRWELSFPTLLALQLNKNKKVEHSSGVITPLHYPINFYYQLDEFRMFDFNTDFSRHCNFIEEKIVIVGYLGPSSEDLFRTPSTNKSDDSTYATVIVANAILDILEDLN